MCVGYIIDYQDLDLSTENVFVGRQVDGALLKSTQAMAAEP